mgnify:CR=1 FL=1
MDIYRGYTITKAIRGYVFAGMEIAGWHKTLKDAMNEIDSIERERVQLENEHIKLTDSIK